MVSVERILHPLISQRGGSRSFVPVGAIYLSKNSFAERMRSVEKDRFDRVLYTCAGCTCIRDGGRRVCALRVDRVECNQAESGSRHGQSDTGILPVIPRTTTTTTRTSIRRRFSLDFSVPMEMTLRSRSDCGLESTSDFFRRENRSTFPPSIDTASSPNSRGREKLSATEQRG